MALWALSLAVLLLQVVATAGGQRSEAREALGGRYGADLSRGTLRQASTPLQLRRLSQAEEPVTEMPIGDSGVPGETPSNGTLVVQVEVEVARLVAADLRLGLLLQRQAPEGDGWSTWSTAREQVVPLRDAAVVPLTLQTLADVERRAAQNADAAFTVTRSFNQLFRALPPGVYRVAVLDRSMCTPFGTCAVLGYSALQELPDAGGKMASRTTLELKYGAIELGLQFTSCANGSACFVPARGVMTSVAIRDAEGTLFSALWQRGNTVWINPRGYAIMGGYLGVERSVQFSTRQGFLSRLRPDVNISQNDTRMMKSLGVLNVTNSQLLCAPAPSGNPYHEFLLTDDVTGVVPRIMHDPSRVFYLPGLQCFWIIAPSSPVRKIQIQFTQMGRGLGQGSSVKIYSLSSARRSQGPVPKLVRNVQGLTQEVVEVVGSRVMVHFSAAEYSPIDNGFQMLWTAVPHEDDSSWFDTRTATIVFSCLAGAAYTIAAIAAWKWYRQRVERQAEEARRVAAREEQRNLRRRHRQEGHRRRRTRGLPLELVSRLPTSSIKLSELEPDAGGEEPMCTICLCEYEEDEKVTWLPCSHSYHTECVASWLKSSLTCPICKDNVKRSLLKTLSMYRELHRGTALPADYEGGTDTDEGRTGGASGSGGPASGAAIEMSSLRLEGLGGDDSSASALPSEPEDAGQPPRAGADPAGGQGTPP